MSDNLDTLSDRELDEPVRITHPDQLRGHHISMVTPSKPGVYRIMTTNVTGMITHANWRYCRADILRVAIETGVVKKSNGRTRP